VAPTILLDKDLQRADENLPPPPSLRTIAGVQGALGVAGLLWILAVHLLTGGFSTAGASPDLTGPPGALKVVAWPWAEVTIDGALVDTTPVARSFSLSPGIHEVVLRNPHFEAVSRRVLIEPGRVQRLKVELPRKKR
jgi:hypothetical protein